jgi:LysR family transcriptional regulator, hydrogen peroxide-inducible genes activator
MIHLTIRQMEYFEALAETLHFGRAARLIGVTQPALSAQIAGMEKRLGCRLFERDARMVRLTEEARTLQPRIERLLREIREIESTAGGRRPMEGRFRLGVIPTVAPYFLPSVLPALKQRFPALSVELRESVTDTLVSETIAGQLDAMVAALPIQHSALAFEELFEDRFLLAAPASEPQFVSPPVAPESPALERLMLLEEGHCLRDQALAICGAVRPMAMSSFGATSLTTLLHMVAHGQGITLIPEMAASSVGNDIAIVPFAEPVPSRRIGLAWRRNSSRRADCREIARVLAGFGTGSGAGGEVDGQPDPQQGEKDQPGPEAVGPVA